ncbi:MAG: hypothetical protein H7Z10_12705 [Gemmatimonadaceae bacterium]|nr:hypothetical protein [Acetobacteraceae bacterium]
MSDTMVLASRMLLTSAICGTLGLPTLAEGALEPAPVADPVSRTVRSEPLPPVAAARHADNAPAADRAD